MSRIFASIRLKKQFQLLLRRLHLFLLFPDKKFNFPELFVGNAENSNLPKFGQKRFHPPDMHIRVLLAGAMPHINGELEHSEPVLHQLLSEIRRGLPLLFGLCRQIKKHENPHNLVFTEPFQIPKLDYYSIIGYTTLRNSPL